MEGQEYLNQISANATVAQAKGSIFKNKFFIIGAIVTVVLILIVIMAVALGGEDKTSEKAIGGNLKLHLDYTEAAIKEYQPHIKNSNLRSDGASLNSIITNTNKELSNYLSEKYKFKEKSASKKTLAKVEKSSKELNDNLFEAKINGILDRIFARKMAYEISTIDSEIANLLKVCKNDSLGQYLTETRSSLENLYPKFNDFSETK